MPLRDLQRLQERLTSVADPVGFLVNLFAHAPVGFAVWNAEGYTLLTNKAFRDLFGSEPPPEYNVLQDDLLAKNGMLALFQRAFAGETVQVPTFWYDPRELTTVTVRDGRRVAISMTIFPLFKPGGEIDYVAATYKDETDIMLAHEQLRRSDERQRLAHSAARVGSFEWNIQTGLNTWTEELERMYGLGPGEFGRTQTSWEALIYPADRAQAVRHVEHALATFVPVEAEWRVLWPDRSVRWLVGRFQAFKDDAGKLHRLIGVNLDITARKQAEDEIRSLNEELERRVQERTVQLDAANRELEAFSYSVAHDLRAPLRAMNGFAQIVLDDYQARLDSEAIGYLRRIQGNAMLMGQLIDALLELGRVTRAELQPVRTDLSAIARAIANRLAAGEPERSMDVVVHDGMWGRIDPALAHVLLENLIGNAWKFTGKVTTRRVEIGCFPSVGAQTFVIRDNGVGFDMSHVDKLFTPFRRLHGEREFPGTGIGLATAQRIVARHGGRIWAEGRVGGGATFFFTLSSEA
jgi:signal transduction histidine kinase